MEYKKPDLTKQDFKKVDNSQNLPFAFEKINYIMMIGGVVIITLGFTIMAMEDAQHGFGFLGLTLGPIVTFLGFMFEIFAILYKKKK
ncbi:DUF3098 domain-containing protein [Bernardetia sp.]|uniref:DUF3098 domain-containing protein n=1 Tax=Bernardetia sp. TaxID=1937974 RepID=UPI0025BDB9CA|nr:DUF3098 domain-containing protein [Bernardetia sp.]